MTMKIILAQPRGFCAGVDRAIDIVILALQVYGAPLYVKHAIVHNAHVVRDLEKKGATFVESIEEIPIGSRVIFSAHGSPPSDYDAARHRSIEIIDATCPLVTKVHLEVKRYVREGYTIILVGHRGHVEMRGTMGEAPEHTYLVETIEDVHALGFSKDTKIAVLTQTTLSVDDTATLLVEIKKVFPQAILPPAADICYATTNRQAAAKALARQCDIVLVMGSITSSNTNRLVEVVRAIGTPAYRIDQVSEIQPEWLSAPMRVGITSGASAPESIVQAVVDRLRSTYGATVETLPVIEERVWFDIPKDLKDVAHDRGIDTDVLSKHTIAQDATMKR
ncbi:MAG: 4-hydroxy-3-methylbut-2-enyl diphosphate reductase [Candidatus Kerfeldbacteria bacterium]|nr:4-hydroxy-3-methylbut-2-enyl diphosphate reductase [Candidatus Kerfeldbacteria bacterium]